MTEYSRPLYENYGLFFMEQEGTPYETVIARYAGDTMEAAGKGRMDLLKGAFREIRIKDKVCAGDNGAEAFGKEITAYMQRKLVKNQLEKFTKKTASLQKTQKQAQEIEKKVEEQRELADLNVSVLELMALIDGISVRNGKLYAGTYFVKMFSLSEKPKAKDFGISNDAVFRAMKKRMDKTPANWDEMQVNHFLERLGKVRDLTKQALQKIDKLRLQYEKVHSRAGSGMEKEQGSIAGLVEAAPVLRGNLLVLKESIKRLKKGVTEGTAEELDALWKDYDTKGIVFDYTGIGEGGGAKNPLDALSALTGNGILNLVCDLPEKLSKKTVSDPDAYALLYRLEQSDAEDCEKRINAFCEKEEVKLSGVLDGKNSYVWEDFCQNCYITDTLGCYLSRTDSKKWKHRLDYQWEYVVAGKKTDRSNLESVLNRILLIRTVLNFFAIYEDSGKKGEAYAAAAAIVGFTGMEPLIRLTQTLILVAWSMVESLVDIAGLLMERDVPVLKKPSQILTSFAELFQISRGALTGRAKRLKKAGKQSFSYSEYVRVFLFSMGREQRRYRVMDIIQWDMRENGYSGFQLGSTVCTMTVQGTAAFGARLFPFVPTRLLGRDLRQYQCVCEVEVSYL